MTCITTYDTNLFCRAPLPPTVRRINKSINERLDRYIRAEKLRQAQELWKTKPCQTLTAFEECLRVASQPISPAEPVRTLGWDDLPHDIQETQPKPQAEIQAKPEEEWRDIPDFPVYEMNGYAWIRNKKRPHINLMRKIGGGKQRSKQYWYVLLGHYAYKQHKVKDLFRQTFPDRPNPEDA